MTDQQHSWGSWMIPEIPISAQFELYRKKDQLGSFNRKQLEDEVVRLMEWDILKKAQLNNALKVITEMQAHLAALTPSNSDPLQRWLDMAAGMKKPPLHSEGCGTQG